MTPEHARARAAEFQKLAAEMRAIANNKKLPEGVRYKGAVLMDHAADIAREFERLEKQ